MRNFVIGSGYLKRLTSVESLMHTAVSVACDSHKQQQLPLTMLMILPLEMKCVLCEVRTEILCII